MAEPRTGTSLINDRFMVYGPLINHGEFFQYSREPQDLRSQLNKFSSVVKVLSTQLSLTQIEEIVSWPETEVIYIKREDKLSTYVSWQKAVEHNLWNNVDTSDIKITLDPEDYAQWYTKSVAWHNEIETIISTKNVLRLVYEQDIDNFQLDKFIETVDNWFVDLDVCLLKSTRLRTWGIKQNLKPIENSINNFGVIEKNYKRY